MFLTLASRVRNVLFHDCLRHLFVLVSIIVNLALPSRDYLFCLCVGTLLFNVERSSWLRACGEGNMFMPEPTWVLLWILEAQFEVGSCSTPGLSLRQNSEPT